MDPSEEKQHRILQQRWEDFKRRFGIASFIDDDGNPIPEFLLSDAYKQMLMDEYTSVYSPNPRPAESTATPEAEPSSDEDADSGA